MQQKARVPSTWYPIAPSIVFEAFNNLDLDFSGDALFRDNGNTFVVGDDIEMDGDAGSTN